MTKTPQPAWHLEEVRYIEEEQSVAALIVCENDGLWGLLEGHTIPNEAAKLINRKSW